MIINSDRKTFIVQATGLCCIVGRTVEKVASWQNGKLTKCQVDKAACRQNDVEQIVSVKHIFKKNY